MAKKELTDSLTNDILDYLECPTRAPTLRYLNRLIYAYIRKVPWESVSRIVKRHTTSEIENCPRWPEEFWVEAIQRGFGGTCYESSLAFYRLLTNLDFEGYLTVNDMGDTRGCHAASVILLNGSKYLVDITIPVHAAVRIDRNRIVRRNTSFHNYTIRPSRENVFDVERSHHPNRNAFTLIDNRVRMPDFRKIVTNDYEESGYFLDSVVMVKVIGDRTWRFFSDHSPYRLESFARGDKSDTLLDPETVPHALSELFDMPEESISSALSWISIPADSIPNN